MVFIVDSFGISCISEDTEVPRMLHSTEPIEADHDWNSSRRAGPDAPGRTDTIAHCRQQPEDGGGAPQRTSHRQPLVRGRREPVGPLADRDLVRAAACARP